MPELPEVETVRRVLEPQLIGRAITKPELRRPEILARPSLEQFLERATGAVFSGMSRRGKYLLLHLEGGAAIILHLRMTGQLLVTPPDFPEEKHTHMVFHLDNGQQLRFADPRRFGRLWLLHEGEEDDFSGAHKLGPEPFDTACNADYLQKKLAKRRKSIKECLLDQSVVAGIGNIYGDEILHAVHIHPTRPASSLKEAEWQALADAIPAVLNVMICENAISPEDYLAGLGREYRNTPAFQVYGRKGLPCNGCGAELQRTVIAGRSSCYCPACQPLE